MAEHRQGTGTRAIFFFYPFSEDALHEVEILLHVCDLKNAQMGETPNYFARVLLSKLLRVYANQRTINPTMIIGKDNCWPRLIQSNATKPRSESGSRKNSAIKRNSP